MPLLLTVAMWCAVSAKTIFVNPLTGNDALGSGNATSPFSSPARAFGVFSDGDTVSLSSGHYSGANAINLQLHDCNGCAIVGAGSQNTVFDCQGGAGSVFSISGAKSHVVIRDLAVQNCRFPASSLASFSIPTAAQSGAALRVVGVSSLTLLRVSLSNHWSSGSGGALVAISSNITMQSCSFFNNNAQVSGGFAFVSWSTVHFVSTTIKHNTATTRGGGLFATDSTLIFDQCTITDNHAYQGGAVLGLSSYLVIRDSIISLNQAAEGGGLFLSRSLLSVSNTLFASNQANGDITGAIQPSRFIAVEDGVAAGGMLCGLCCVCYALYFALVCTVCWADVAVCCR